jgi:hypothetical protein
LPFFVWVLDEEAQPPVVHVGGGLSPPDEDDDDELDEDDDDELEGAGEPVQDVTLVLPLGHEAFADVISGMVEVHLATSFPGHVASAPAVSGPKHWQ